MRLDGYEEQIKDISLELTRYLVQHGANLEVAEDVVQNIFVKVLEMDLICHRLRLGRICTKWPSGNILIIIDGSKDSK